MAPQIAAFCDAAVSLEGVLANPPLLAGWPPDQVKAAVQAFGANVEPALATVEQTAPNAVKPSTTTMAQVARGAFATGDLTQLSQEPFGAAKTGLEQYMVASCGYPQVPVTAIEYRYEGLPASVAAGNTAFTLINNGEETHGLALIRVTDGVTDSVDQLLSQTGAEYTAKLTPVAFTFADPASMTTTFVRLTPGRYIAVDFVPQGTEPGKDSAGSRHYLLGMKGEFKSCLSC